MKEYTTWRRFLAWSGFAFWIAVIVIISILSIKIINIDTHGATRHYNESPLNPYK
jgi:heme exporter protein D